MLPQGHMRGGRFIVCTAFPAVELGTLVCLCTLVCQEWSFISDQVRFAPKCPPTQCLVDEVA